MGLRLKMTQKPTNRWFQIIHSAILFRISINQGAIVTPDQYSWLGGAGKTTYPKDPCLNEQRSHHTRSQQSQSSGHDDVFGKCGWLPQVSLTASMQYGFTRAFRESPSGAPPRVGWVTDHKGMVITSQGPPMEIPLPSRSFHRVRD